MTSSRRILGSLALTAALAAAPLRAQPGPGHGGRMGGGRMGGMLRQALASLDLTQDQKDKIHAVLDAEKPAMQALREQMRTDAKALRATADTSSDPATVGKAFLKVKADREAMKAERQKIRTQIESYLTPEQKTKLDGFLSAVRARGRGRWNQQ
jgi:Spy/CpxP family protein refolding chaperone